MNRSEEPRDIRKLTDEIRKLGLPYSSSEPEPLFWANQRVRIMDRIGERESLSFVEQIREWIASHVLGTSIAGAALAGLVAIAVMLAPDDQQKPVAVVSKPAPSVATPPEHVTVQQSIAQVTNDMQKAESKPHAIVTHREKAVEYAVLGDEITAPTLGSSDVEHPVNLEDLSESDLQGVLNSIQSLQ